jgi:hypothetical protein
MKVEAARVRRVEAGGFTVTEGIHRTGTALPWHDHVTPTICFVLSGGFTEFWQGGSVACTSSTLKITPAGERHWDRFNRGDVRGLLIEADQPQVAMIRPTSDTHPMAGSCLPSAGDCTARCRKPTRQPRSPLREFCWS